MTNFNIIIAIGVLLVVALVMFFMFRTKPKKPEKTIVAITPPSGGEIAETYIEFADPSISVSGLSVTLPTNYGQYTYSDNSTGPAELVKLTIRLIQQDTLLGKREFFKQTSPNAPLPNWFSEASGAGQNFIVEPPMLDTLAAYNPTGGQLRAEVEFQNDPLLTAPGYKVSVDLQFTERYRTGLGEALAGGAIGGGVASLSGVALPRQIKTLENINMLVSPDPFNAENAVSSGYPGGDPATRWYLEPTGVPNEYRIYSGTATQSSRTTDNPRCIKRGSDGNNVDSFGCSGDNKWLINTADGTIKNTKENKCLAWRASNSNFELHNCSEGKNQRFIIDPVFDL